MKKIFFPTSILIISSIYICFGQSAIKWQKNYGGSNNEYGYSILGCSNGGYLLAGSSGSNDFDVVKNYGGDDVWLSKISISGNIEWERNYGGSANDVAYSVIETNDRGYVFAGYTTSNDSDVSGNAGAADVWVVKIDSSGDIIWQSTLGGSANDYARAIIQTTDNGYVFAGYTNSNNGDVSGNHGGYDYWVVKLDSGGNLEWQEALGGGNFDQAYAIALTNDSGFVVTGYVSSNDGNVSGNHGSQDMWTVKLDISGNLLWQKAMGGGNSDFAYSIMQAQDGNYLIGGTSNSSDGDIVTNYGNFDYCIIKFDTARNIIWQKTLGGSGQDEAKSIIQDWDGGFAITGFSFSNDSDVVGSHGLLDYWLVKIDSLGNIQWQKAMGGTVDDVSQSVIQTGSNNYMVAGYAESNNGNSSSNYGMKDYWVLKLCGGVQQTEVTINLCEGDSVFAGGAWRHTNGIYYDTLFTYDGCDSLVASDVSVQIIDTTIVDIGGILTANMGGAIYQWIDCNTGLDIPGAVGQIFVPSASGSYSVVVVENGCKDTSSCYEVINSNISDYGNSNLLNIYYNNQQIIIEKLNDTPIIYDIINISGQIIFSEIITESKKINLRALNSGLYIVYVQDFFGQNSIFKIPHVVIK